MYGWVVGEQIESRRTGTDSESVILQNVVTSELGLPLVNVITVLGLLRHQDVALRVVQTRLPSLQGFLSLSGFLVLLPFLDLIFACFILILLQGHQRQSRGALFSRIEPNGDGYARWDHAQS